jgi:DNA-binding NarL/FixJ family response regulator
VQSESALPVVVIAAPGLMCESLVTFLESIRGVHVAAVLDSSCAALPVHADDAHVVIVDGNANKDLVAQLAVLHARAPRFRWIVLIDNVQQQRVFLAAGADSVLLKGFLDERLEQAVLAVG